MTSKLSNISRIATVLLAYPMLLVSGGCVNQQALNARLDRMERGLSEMRSVQAEQSAQITTLQTSIRESQGKIEELEFVQERRLGGALVDLRKDLSTIQKRVPPPAVVPLKQLEADEALADRLPAELAPKLSEGLLRIREGSFREAMLPLQEGLSLSVSADYGAPFAFWLGVAYEGSGDMNGALSAYSEFGGKFRKNSRAPLALLRQSEVLINLNDKKAAKLTLQKLIAEYPKAPEASEARNRLKNL